MRYVDEAVIKLGECRTWDGYLDKALSLRTLSTHLTEVRTLKLRSIEALEIFSVQPPTRQSSGRGEALPRGRIVH
jgi:hypothetical protein